MTGVYERGLGLGVLGVGAFTFATTVADPFLGIRPVAVGQFGIVASLLVYGVSRSETD
ncbi:hypothetical protein [Haloprofundus halobius]|uniref:hypothetical protein n=1 Tax=Haloprofundus halobius TaxID=2876194 RepID=UPI001CC9C6A6|nr:hypothetical protein [Haloprofundus halobius]